MSSKTNYSYVGIAFIILVFGIIFIPRIIDRISNDDVSRSESRSNSVATDQKDDTTSGLAFIEINGDKKKVPNFSFKNQNEEIITNNNYEGKVYVVEFFFSTCPTICPKMNRNLIQIQNEFKGFENFGVASFTINPKYDTSKVLKEYADQYGVTNSNWHLMTGDEKAIYDLSNNGFSLYTAKDDEAEGGFEHSGNFALIDKNGFIRSRRDSFGNPLIFYRGTISEEEKFDEDGEPEQISILKEDIAKLLEE